MMLFAALLLSSQVEAPPMLVVPSPPPAPTHGEFACSMYANDGGEHHISGRFENRNESQDNGRADFVISSSDIDLPIIEFSGIAQAKYVAFGEYDESTGALVTGEIHTGQSGYVIFKVRAHRGSDQMTYVGFCKATLAFEAEAKN